MVVALTVRLTVALKESAHSNWLFAMNAHEMLWMPQPSKRRYHLSNYWLGTRSTVALERRNDALS